MDSIRTAQDDHHSAVTTKVIRYSVTMTVELPEKPGIRDVKAHISDYVNWVIFRRDRLRIHKNGKPVVGLVTIEDLDRLAVLDTWPYLLEKVDAEVERLRAES